MTVFVHEVYRYDKFYDKSIVESFDGLVGNLPPDERIPLRIWSRTCLAPARARVITIPYCEKQHYKFESTIITLIDTYLVF